MTLSARDLTLRVPIDGRHRKMLIDGKWCDASSGRSFETRNPATGAVIGTVPQADAADVELAVAAARRAFEGPWSKFKPYERQLLLLKIADVVDVVEGAFRDVGRDGKLRQAAAARSP